MSAVAEMLGVSRQRADELTRRAGFPEPLTSGRMRAWDRDAVERWLDDQRPGWREKS
nr:helix-turn-helix domain-containing protein [Frankia sp. R43]